jgi:hypothetical protein
MRSRLKKRSTRCRPACRVCAPGQHRSHNGALRTPWHRCSRRNQPAGEGRRGRAQHCHRLASHHRQARGHRLQDGVGNALGERRQHEAVEAAHDGGCRCVRPPATPGRAPALPRAASPYRCAKALTHDDKAQPFRAHDELCTLRRKARTRSVWFFTGCSRPTVPISHRPCV